MSAQKPVILFPDTFNNYFYPHTLKAATVILEHWGYLVTVPRGRISVIHPLIHYGKLNLAKWEITNLSKMIGDQNLIPAVNDKEPDELVMQMGSVAEHRFWMVLR